MALTITILLCVFITLGKTNAEEFERTTRVRDQICDLRTRDLETGGWRMVFKANAGNGHNVYDAWTTGQNTTNVKPDSLKCSNGLHYRDDSIDNWSSLGVFFVKFAFYNYEREVVHVLFNGIGSDIKSWFSKHKVMSSSYPDLTVKDSFNIFSMEGDARPTFQRRFFINRRYAGCGGDVGHIVVSDVGTTAGCIWDQHLAYPQFLYSQIRAVDRWIYRLFGRADVMAILIKAH